MFVGPFGDGQNAPPSNEDIAGVVAGVLANPGPHIGKSYRPTGPELLSPRDMAGILTNVVGRKVKYRDVSMKMFAKAAKALGGIESEIAQMRHYVKEIRHGAFAIGAPTDHVELVTGRKPESFESITRRYTDDPSQIHPKLTKGGKRAACGFMLRMMLARVPDFEQWERDKGHPVLTEPFLAHESDEWRATAERQVLNLLPVQSHDASATILSRVG